LPTSITPLQIAFDWSDLHLHSFHIHGQDYGISRNGGVSLSSDPRKVHLGEFRFTINKRFVYEYDFGDRWEHEVRNERRLPLVGKKTYPVCIGGPEQDCGGPWAYVEYVDDHWCHPPLDDEEIRQVLSDMDELREAVELRWRGRRTSKGCHHGADRIDYFRFGLRRFRTQLREEIE
jgi:hypothetical protein